MYGSDILKNISQVKADCDLRFLTSLIVSTDS